MPSVRWSRSLPTESHQHIRRGRGGGTVQDWLLGGARRVRTIQCRRRKSELVVGWNHLDLLLIRVCGRLRFGAPLRTFVRGFLGSNPDVWRPSHLTFLTNTKW